MTNEELEAENKRLKIQNWQLKGALGYPVPSDIPEGEFKCGLCEARRQDRDMIAAALAAMQANIQARFESDLPDAQAKLTAELCERIRPILAGRPEQVQSAVLADLLSIWLAGHFADDKTNELREELLAGHIQLVKDLIPANEQMILAQTRAASS